VTDKREKIGREFYPSGPLSRVQERLERVDKAVDWSRFDKYLHWLKSDFVSDESFEPVLLFKAMLVLHWHAYTAPEYDHAIEDSMAVRHFVGIKPGDPGPRHITVNAFRRFLVDRGRAAEALAELHRQLSQNGLLSFDQQDFEIDENPSRDKLYSLANDIRMDRPATWLSIENDFIGFWSDGGNSTDLPTVNFEDHFGIPEELEPQILVLGIQGDSFRVERVGGAIKEQFRDNLEGTSIGLKLPSDYSTAKYRLPQDELISVCRAAAERGKPVATSTRFETDDGKEQELWAVFAPALDSNTGVVCLVGAALILSDVAPLTDYREASPFALSMLPGAVDPFSLETSYRALGPSHWDTLENAFLRYWNEQRGIHKTPLTSNMKLSDIPDLEPHLTLTRVIEDRGFQYELIGDHIQNQNEGDATGQFIAEKRDFNIREFGHGGLQEELGSVFSRALAQLKPVGTNTYYVNSGGTRCQMWTIHAPMSDEYGNVCMLIGVTLIQKISIN
jgi:hypothetical protein